MENKEQINNKQDNNNDEIEIKKILEKNDTKNSTIENEDELFEKIEKINENLINFITEKLNRILLKNNFDYFDLEKEYNEFIEALNFSNFYNTNILKDKEIKKILISRLKNLNTKKILISNKIMKIFVILSSTFNKEELNKVYFILKLLITDITDLTNLLLQKVTLIKGKKIIEEKSIEQFISKDEIQKKILEDAIYLVNYYNYILVKYLLDLLLSLEVAIKNILFSTSKK